MHNKTRIDEDHVPGTYNSETVRPSFWKRSLVAVLALCLVIWQIVQFRQPTKLAGLSCHEQYDGRVHYENENIPWTPCGDVNGRPVECSNITVPVDQFDKHNLENKTFTIPLIRMRGSNATQNLLLNPGGPGGSGMEFLFRKGKLLHDIVGEGFHLLSFDPRGVNGSQPLASCYATKDVRRSHLDVASYELVHDSPQVYAWAQNFAKACEDTMKEYGPYINTPQTAADMNSILEAVGQEDMIYWGFSYGTILGQTYATLFPERSWRIIVDGVANNFVWYGDFIDTEQFTDTENVLAGFFDECFKAGKNCSLTSLANTPEELRERVFALSEKLKQQPISVYINSTTYGLLDYPSLWYNGIFPALYRPASWHSLATNLANLLQGNATDAWLAYARQPAWDMGSEANQVVTHNDGLSGPQYWPQDRERLLGKILDKLNGSIFGPTENGDIYERAQWSIPRTHNFTQKHKVETAHPLLILSTTFDPICPLVSAKSAKSAFVGSQIVEVEGYGHCSVAVGSTCLAKRVRAFLYHGDVPQNHTKCEVDAPYFVAPETNGQIVALKTFEDPEEEKIHLAQLQLARDWQWKHLPFH